MTILVLSNLYPPDFIGGYELACAHVVDALRARGHDVQVLTAAPRHPVPSMPHVHRRLKLIDEWSPNGMAASPMARGLDEVESRQVNAYNVHSLTTALEEFEPDVVYVCNIVGIGGLGLMACLQYLGVPWVWQLGDIVPRMLCTLRGREILALEKEFTRTIIGNYIVVSRQLLREIERTEITLNGRVEVIPNWITGERPASRADYYRGGRLRIMSAGTVTREKGVDIVIEAASRLREAGLDDFSVDIYGKVLDPTLGGMIGRLGLEGHVSLKGVRPHVELLDLYRHYDVFTFPTHPREPFGMVPLEALARGCVPVMSHTCGIAEYLVHGVHCFKVDRSAESFARLLADVLRGEIDLESIGRRGETTVWRDFHIDAILPRTERLLIEASNRPRGRLGTAAGAYRMARMAEQLSQAFVQESLCT